MNPSISVRKPHKSSLDLDLNLGKFPMVWGWHCKQFPCHGLNEAEGANPICVCSLGVTSNSHWGFMRMSLTLERVQCKPTGVFFVSFPLSCTRQSRQWSCRKRTRLVLFNFGLLNLLSLPLPSGYFYGSKRKCSFYVLGLCMGVTHLAILIRGRVGFILKSPPELFRWKRKWSDCRMRLFAARGGFYLSWCFWFCRITRLKRKYPAWTAKNAHSRESQSGIFLFWRARCSSGWEKLGILHIWVKGDNTTPCSRHGSSSWAAFPWIVDGSCSHRGIVWFLQGKNEAQTSPRAVFVLLVSFSTVGCDSSGSSVFM